MESFVAPLPHRRPTRTFRSLLHHLCSTFDRENQISLATPAVLQELVLTTEIAQVTPGETSVCPEEKPAENSWILESRSDGGSGELRAENVETISQGKSLMLGDVFDLEDASLGSQHKDFFDELELMMNESEDIVPENCVNLFEALDVNDYDDDGMAKQALDLAQTVAEKPEEVPNLVESDEVISGGVLEINNGILGREMETVNSSQVLAASISQMVEDDEVEEGEISGDDNDNMLIEDDLPVKSYEESQEVLDKREAGTSKSLFFGVDVLKVENGVKEKDQTSKNQDKMASGTCIKKRSKEAKARKKAKSRKKRAQERISLGVKKLKLKPVAPKPKPIKYCRHYLKGRCHEGEKCKFSHDTTPETKSSPCCYFATQSCMKGDDCPYDHDLSKYPCNNFITKGFCHRGDNCLFSHKGTPQSASENVTTSSTKQTVREAIAKLPAIQARVSSPATFLNPSSQSIQRNSSSPKMNEHVTPPLRKPSVAPKGMSFLSLDKTSQEDTVKAKHTRLDSDNQSLKQRSFHPPKGTSFLSFASEALYQEPASSRNLKTRHSSHIQTSLNSAMKLAAEFESAKVNDPVNKGDVTVNTSVTRNSGNISSKILDFLSTFSNGKN